MKERFKNALHRIRWHSALIVLLVVVNLGMVGYIAFATSEPYPELTELSGKELGFKDLSNYFSAIAEKKGAVYAFEILRRADLPPNVDIHLLGHVVGDILYKQQGTEAISLCTPDFRNACSHTIVVGTLLEKGPESLSEMAGICRRAPGGTGAYAMCFHGLGHGVLAFNEYELSVGVKMCEKIKNVDGREFVECVGGMIMEMIAGVHDREVWLEKVDKYFKEEDPLYPCSADFMPNEAKGICYTYLTPHLFETAGADLGYPSPESFEKAFRYCEPLSGASRRACFGGFGKEFVVLAQNRDIRAIDQMTDSQFGKVIDWCLLARPQDAKEDCIESAMASILWGGENDPRAAVRYCSVAFARSYGDACFMPLAPAIAHYIQDQNLRAELCNAFPEKYTNQCLKQRI